MREPALTDPAYPLSQDLIEGLNFTIRANYSAAAGCYRRAIDHDPQSALARYLLGPTLMAQGEVEDARAEWETAARADSEDIDTVWAQTCVAMLRDSAQRAAAESRVADPIQTERKALQGKIASQ